MSEGIELLTISYAVIDSLFSELSPAEYRYYSGTSLDCNLASTLSSFLPFIAIWMNGMQTVKTPMPAIIALVAISLLTALGGFIGEQLRVKDQIVVRAG